MEPPRSDHARRETPRPSSPRDRLDSLSAVLQSRILRILDVNGNRASEGLRVVEDYLRFALDDGHLVGRCKSIRHELADCLGQLPQSETVLARDAVTDVGRPLKTEQELSRAGDTEVLRANLKRVQQAFRSLEEWTKVIHRGVAQAFENLRYQVYELESAVERREASVSDLHGATLRPDRWR